VAPINQPPAAFFYRPVIPITLALMAGIILGERLPGMAVAAIIIVAGTAVYLTVCLRRRLPAWWSAVLMIMAAGYLSMVPWMSPRHGPDHIVHYLDTGYWRINGTVVGRPVIRFGRTRAILHVNTIARDGVSHSVRGRIKVTVMGEDRLIPGDRVTFPSKIRPFRNFRNPGGFDYRRYMAFQGVHGSAWVKADALKTNGLNRPLASRLIQATRHRLSHRIDMTVGEERAEAKAVLKALVMGDRSGIHPTLRESFSRAGVSHLLAISGLHVGIVAAVAVAFFKWGFSFLSPLRWRGWTRGWAAAAALVPVLAYGLLAGMSQSTQRAEVMAAVFLFALILGREYDTLNTLTVAALVILTLFPPSLFTISFQLSFAAVLAIVYGLEKMRSDRERTQVPINRMGQRLITFLLVSALAIAGTAPVVMFYFNQTSVVGIAANLFLIPLIGFLAVPLGLLSAFISLFFESAAGLGFWLCIQIIHLALILVDFFSALSFAAVNTVTPTLLEIGLYYVICWALLSLREKRVAPWVLAATMIVLAGDVLYWSHQRFWHRDLRVTAIDVGQGGSTIVELPEGTVFLYDGGGFSDNRLFDIGQRVVAPLLWRKKIATVDYLVLSHPNADHLNGLIYIAGHFNVRELWTNGDEHTTRGYARLMAVCREKGIVVRNLNAGTGDTVIGPVTLTVLHPPEDFLSYGKKIDQGDLNNDSLVLKVSFKETGFLLTGDIMARAEKRLVQQTADLGSTVLFAPHHGSRTSSSLALIRAVNPEMAVISAGAGNRFGFPHSEVTDRYRAAGCRILCTGTHGAISMRSNGKDVEVKSFEDLEEQAP
jgi:competence protein ComEC